MKTPSSILAWKIPWTEEPGILHLGLGQVQTHSCGLVNVKATFCKGL